jgi:hypothetical protein
MVASIAGSSIASRTDAEKGAIDGAMFGICETVPATRRAPDGLRGGSISSDEFVE